MYQYKGSLCTKNLIDPKLYIIPTKNLIELKLYSNNETDNTNETDNNNGTKTTQSKANVKKIHQICQFLFLDNFPSTTY